MVIRIVFAGVVFMVVGNGVVMQKFSNLPLSILGMSIVHSRVFFLADTAGHVLLHLPHVVLHLPPAL